MTFDFISLEVGLITNVVCFVLFFTVVFALWGRRGGDFGPEERRDDGGVVIFSTLGGGALVYNTMTSSSSSSRVKSTIT